MRNATLLATAILFTSSAPGAARTWEDKKHHVSLEVDESAGWKIMDPDPQKRMLFVAAQPGDPPPLSVILLWAPVALGEDSINQHFITNFEAGQRDSMRKGGGKVTKLSSRRFKMDGVPAYENAHQIEARGMKLQQVTRVTMANGRLYMLMGQGIGLDIERDRLVLPLMNSFKFTKKPGFKPFDVPNAGGEAGGVVDKDSEAYQIGFLVGQIFIGALVLVLIIYLLRRKSRSRAQ